MIIFQFCFQLEEAVFSTMFQHILTRIEGKRIKWKKLQIFFIWHHKCVEYYDSHRLLSSLHRADKYLHQVFVSYSFSVENFHLPFSFQTFGLGHRTSLACPYCTAVESKKRFSLVGPQYQHNCEYSWIVPPFPWTWLYSLRATDFGICQTSLLQRPANNSIAITCWSPRLAL